MSFFVHIECDLSSNNQNLCCLSLQVSVGETFAARRLLIRLAIILLYVGDGQYYY